MELMSNVGVPMTRPYFNGSSLPKNPAPEYVVWVDVMGTQARMSRSLEQSANFVFKLHVAAISAIEAVPGDGLNVYPVMDGFYASSVTQRTMSVSSGACLGAWQRNSAAQRSSCIDF